VLVAAGNHTFPEMGFSVGKSSSHVQVGNRAQRRAAAKVQRRRRAATAAQISASGLILAAGIGVIGTPAVQAGANPGTLVVTSLLDVASTDPGYVGTLRSAIENANNSSGPQSITFAVSGSIVLTQGQLLITDTVSITGPGADQLSISGGGSSRVIEARGSVDFYGCVAYDFYGACIRYGYAPGPEVDVSISGVTITGGYSGGSGSGVKAYDVGLSLADVVLSNNVTTGSGGGLYFTDNGDAANDLTISGSEISGNTASGDGGALYADSQSGDITIVDSEFSNNTSGRQGGAIGVNDFGEGAVMRIERTMISGNEARRGGGVSLYNIGGNVSIIDVELLDNVANNGAGLFLYDVFENASVTVDGATITGNEATDDGGGVYLYDVDGSVSIVDSVISDNTAGSDGGGVYLYGIDGSGSVAIDNTEISGNTSEGSGGGVALAQDLGGSLSINDSTISDNTSAGGGGGLYLSLSGEYGDVAITDTVVSGNVAGGDGGGIAAPSGGRTGVALRVENSVITDNASGYNGGGVLAAAYELSIIDSTIADNTAGFSGGGLDLRDAGPITRAAAGPEALNFNYGRSAVIEGSTISGNAVTGGSGGGVAISDGSPVVEIRQSTVSGNSASGAGGGVNAANGYVLAVAGSTIADNTSGDVGGGIAVLYGEADLRDTIVADNSAAAGPNDLDGGGTFDVSYSLIETADEAVLDSFDSSILGEDPKLGPLAANGGSTLTHLISGTSPAAEAGSPEYELIGDGPTDQRGAARFVGARDIGAVELQASTVEFVEAAASVSEETGTLVVEIERGTLAEGAASVTVSPVFASAVAADVASAPMTVSWADGENGVKTVNLGVVLDALHEDDETLTLTFADPSGVEAGLMSSMVVTITNSNSAPIVGDVADVSLTANTPSGEIAIAVGDDEQAAGDLTVTVSSANQSVVADAGLLLGGSGANRTLVVSPVAGATGSSLITVTVSDGKLTATDTFTVTVGAGAGLVAPPVSQVNGQAVSGGSVVTDDSTPTLTGTGQAGAQVDVYVTGNALIAANAAPGGFKVCTTTVGSNGQWSCTVSSPLPVGSYSMAVVQTLGNETSSASTFRLQVTGGGQLPATGNRPDGLAWFGAGLLGLGAALTGAGRRRRTTK
jgi:hypothetical protein